MSDKYCECEYCSSQGEASECWALMKIAALETKVAELTSHNSESAQCDNCIYVQMGECS
jgi:hypothetical protein